MELVWLEDFNTLAENGNFSRSAELRHVSQPAFSRRIRALEGWVGVDLFERTAQGATLTDAGQSMLENARELSRRLYQMRSDVREVAGKAARTLHFAATHSLSFTFFPAWIRGVGGGLPIGAIRLDSNNMMACEQSLLNGEVQFLICHQHPAVPPRFESDQFESRVIGIDTLIPLQSPELPTGQNTPLLAYTAESGLGRIIASHRLQYQDDACTQTVFSSHLAAVLLSMALQAKGVAWLPETLAAAEIASGRLVRAATKAENIPTEIRIFRAKMPIGQFAESFWDALPHGA